MNRDERDLLICLTKTTLRYSPMAFAIRKETERLVGKITAPPIAGFEQPVPLTTKWGFPVFQMPAEPVAQVGPIWQTTNDAKPRETHVASKPTSFDMITMLENMHRLATNTQRNLQVMIGAELDAVGADMVPNAFKRRKTMVGNDPRIETDENYRSRLSDAFSGRIGAINQVIAMTVTKPVETVQQRVDRQALERGCQCDICKATRAKESKN